MMEELRLAFLGFGSANRALARMLLEKSEPSPDPSICPWRHLRIPTSSGGDDSTRLVPWRVVAIITRRHGIVHVPLGVEPELSVHEIDLEDALKLVESGESLNDSVIIQKGEAPPIVSKPTPYSDKSFGGGIISNITNMYSALSHTEQTTCLINILGCSQTANILVEAIPSDPKGDGEPAIGFITKALKAGMHVASANKSPLAHCNSTDHKETYWSLQQLAKDNNVMYKHESAAMDGVPIFSLWKYTLCHAKLTSIRGCLNGTTTMILSRMEGSLSLDHDDDDGESFEEALDAAKKMGIVEADESLDVDGYDAAVKLRAMLVVMTTSSMESSSSCSDDKVRITTMGEIPRDSIRSVTREDIRRAYADGRKKYRLVASAKLVDSSPSSTNSDNSSMNSCTEAKRWEASVQLKLLPPSDPLYNLSGTDASVTFCTDVLGPVTLVSSNPTLVDTAYGLFSDIVRVAGEGQ